MDRLADKPAPLTIDMTLAMTSAFIRRLTLTQFPQLSRRADALDKAGPVVLTGANGAGKTNLIEAISMLAPGRGPAPRHDGRTRLLRRRRRLGGGRRDRGHARPGHARHRHRSAGGRGSAPARKCRIDRESVGSAAAFADHLRVVWLTPAMDPLFNGPASERRRFLDRLVLAVDAQHSSRVAALERSLRSRNRLLEDPSSDAHWLDAIEHETAEVAVAVAAARAETVARLAAALHAARDQAPGFPLAEIALDGWMEKLLPHHSATEIEDRYRDAAQGKPRARRRRRPHARRPASAPTSRSPMPARAFPRRRPRPASRRRC